MVPPSATAQVPAVGPGTDSPAMSVSPGDDKVQPSLSPSYGVSYSSPTSPQDQVKRSAAAPVYTSYLKPWRPKKRRKAKGILHPHRAALWGFPPPGSRGASHGSQREHQPANNQTPCASIWWGAEKKLQEYLPRKRNILLKRDTPPHRRITNVPTVSQKHTLTFLCFQKVSTVRFNYILAIRK